MATFEELHQALGETLQARGVAGSVKAKLRAEIFGILEGEGAVAAPKPSNENVVINELIREYLAFNGYEHTLSVFAPESGQPKEPALPRSMLAHDLHVEDQPRYAARGTSKKPLPLLYSVVRGMQTKYDQAPL